MLLISLVLVTTLAAQNIPHTVNVLDCNTSPENNYDLEEEFQTSNGVYLKHEYFEEVNIISFFDGVAVTELFRTEMSLNFVGGTTEGVYINVATEESFESNLLFISLGGEADTLNEAPLYSPDFYQWGDNLYTFSRNTGIRSFTPSGTETLLAMEFLRCSCPDAFLEYDDKLVFQTQSSVRITDGTPEGTRTILPVGGELLVYDNKLFVVNSSDFLYVYDPVTEEATNLINDHPNVSGNFFDPEDFTITDHGILFIATTPEAGRELYITDGTSESTRLLTEINPGPEDGISWQGSPRPVSVGKNIIFRRGAENDSGEIWISDGSDTGTYLLLDYEDDLPGFGVINGSVLAGGKLILNVNFWK